MLNRTLLRLDSADKDVLPPMLKDLDAIVTWSSPSEDFWASISASSFDFVLVSDAHLPAPREETIAAIRALPSRPDVIVLGTFSEARRASLIAAGCRETLSTKIDAALLRETLREILHSRREHRALATDGEEPSTRLGNFVSTSPAMIDLIRIARRVAASDTSVLILGETGVGKETFARAVHSEGARADNPFIAVNCGAIPETLVESHLFGHRAGAFTGAVEDHRGYFEIAHGGTIFLDEIGEMSPAMQVRMLRVLQESTFRRVGGEKEIEVNARVLAATNRNPKVEMKNGRLREDLYYRLGVVTLLVPPLRERHEDIPALVRQYTDSFATRLNRPKPMISDNVMTALITYAWPGNVRELMNVIERAVLLARSDTLLMSDLPPEIGQGIPRGYDFRDAAGASNRTQFAEAKRHVLNAFEHSYFTDVLKQSRGRVGVAARRSGLSSRGLYQKMKKYNLKKEDFIEE